MSKSFIKTWKKSPSSRMHFANINIESTSNNKRFSVYSSNVSNLQRAQQQRPKSWMRLKRKQNLDKNIDTSTNISTVFLKVAILFTFK